MIREEGAASAWAEAGQKRWVRVWLVLDRHGRCWGKIWGQLGTDIRPTQGYSKREGEGTSGSPGVTRPTGNQRGRDYPM